MTKLSDSQLNVLSAAAAREGGEAVVPANMNKSAAAKVGSSLVARKLARELKTKPGMPVWREDANGRLISLIITKAGRKAIGVSDVAPDKNRNTNHKASTSGKTRPEGRENVKSGVTTAARAGSKQALVIEMLNAGSGVTLDALVGATGWLPHTTRAALTGLRKKGFSIERFSKGDASFYRIARTTPSAAA